jgi:hypothetical protein
MRHHHRFVLHLTTLGLTLAAVGLAASCQHSQTTAGTAGAQAGGHAMSDNLIPAKVEGETGSAAGQAVPGVTGRQELAASAKALTVEISNGTVDIRAAAADGQASASWEIVKAGGAPAAPANTLQLQVDQQADGQLRIHDKYTGDKLASPPTVHLTITLPATVPVNASLGNGKLSIDSNAKLSAAVGNGTLLLAGSYPATDASVGNGDIKGEVQLGAGEHQLNVGNGAVELGLRPGSSFSFDADTGIGEVQLSGVPGKIERNMLSQTARGVLGTGDGKLEISIGNGSVKLRSAGAAANGSV